MSASNGWPRTALSASWTAEGFAELLDAELKLMEENNRLQRESGGCFVSLAGGFHRAIYPARDEGPSPLELEDRFTN